jgi:beta-lactam-binding protein with PASTA domain
MPRTDSLRNFLISRRFLYNVLGAAAFYLGFIVVFALFVRWYTNHGESVAVPDVKELSFEEAKISLTDSHLKAEISDSLFDNSKPGLSVLDQNPRPGSRVKTDRTIYLTVNAKAAPEIKMPDLKDVSLKQASLILQSYGLSVGKLTYKPDLAKDVVLGMTSEGKSVAPGSSVKKGSRIDLVLGDGLGQTQVEVPNITGLTLREAKVILDGSSLNLGAIVPDASVEGDTLDAVIYRQAPDPNMIPVPLMNIGEGVDVFITSPRDYDSKNNEEEIE